MQDAGLLRRPTSHHSDPQLPTVYTPFWVRATSSIHSNDRYFPPTPRCGGWRVTWDKHGMALADQFVGTQVEVPVLDGTTRRYINFDNAASTPSLKVVRDGVVAFLENYASVHRGTGFKSQLSTWAYDQARLEVLRFLDADPGEQVCLFGKNTTDALNKLARRLPLRPGEVVLTTEMEHHSDDLPFRGVATVLHAAVLPDGRLDEADFDRLLDAHRGRVRLVGGRAAGAWIVVDAAQLAPHRAIHMRPLADPEHFDFVALSGHKLYAPFGTGALVGRRDLFEHGDPEERGGGTVEIVTLDEVIWAEPPEREEAGSPNVVGAVALGLALSRLADIGMETIAAHEAKLTAHALRRLAEIPGVRIYGDPRPATAPHRLRAVPLAVSR